MIRHSLWGDLAYTPWERVEKEARSFCRRDLVEHIGPAVEACKVIEARYEVEAVLTLVELRASLARARRGTQ